MYLILKKFEFEWNVLKLNEKTLFRAWDPMLLEQIYSLEDYVAVAYTYPKVH